MKNFRLKIKRRICLPLK